MSTILDALRKVEEEQRVSSHSTRERLLFFHQVTRPPPSSRKGTWVIGLVLVGVGFAGGLGMTLFRSEPTASIPAEEQGSEMNSPQYLSTSTQDAPVPRSHSGGLPEFSVGDLPFPSTIQRSPIATSRKPYNSKQLRAASVPPSPLGTPKGAPKGAPKGIPKGIPKVSLNLLQWSPEVEKRLAFISLNGGPMIMVHEGDTVSDFMVERILPDTVELRFGDSTFVVKPRAIPSLPAPLAP